jgi:hypothetical protein
MRFIADEQSYVPRAARRFGASASVWVLPFPKELPDFIDDPRSKTLPRNESPRSGDAFRQRIAVDAMRTAVAAIGALVERSHCLLVPRRQAAPLERDQLRPAMRRQRLHPRDVPDRTDMPAHERVPALFRHVDHVFEHAHDPLPGPRAALLHTGKRFSNANGRNPPCRGS